MSIIAKFKVEVLTRAIRDLVLDGVADVPVLIRSSLPQLLLQRRLLINSSLRRVLENIRGIAPAVDVGRSLQHVLEVHLGKRGLLLLTVTVKFKKKLTISSCSCSTPPAD